MPFCNKCGTEVPENTNFCQKCGEQQAGGSRGAIEEMVAKMGKQKIALAVASVIGMLGMVMPWVTHPLKADVASGGAFFIIFAFPIVVIFLKDKNFFPNLNLSFKLMLCLAPIVGPIVLFKTEKGRYVLSAICGALGLLLVYAVSSSIKLGPLSSWGLGLYLTAIAGVAVIGLSIAIIRDISLASNTGEKK